MANVYSELREREKQNQSSFRNNMSEMEQKVEQQNEMA